MCFGCVWPKHTYSHSEKGEWVSFVYLDRLKINLCTFRKSVSFNCFFFFFICTYLAATSKRWRDTSNIYTLSEKTQEHKKKQQFQCMSMLFFFGVLHMLSLQLSSSSWLRLIGFKTPKSALFTDFHMIFVDHVNSTNTINYSALLQNSPWISEVLEVAGFEILEEHCIFIFTQGSDVFCKLNLQILHFIRIRGWTNAIIFKTRTTSFSILYTYVLSGCH